MRDLAAALFISIAIAVIAISVKGCFQSADERDRLIAVEREKTQQMQYQWKMDSIKAEGNHEKKTH